jgi:hypothetical protein
LEIQLDDPKAINYFYSTGEAERNYVKSTWDGYIVIGSSTDSLVGNIKDVRLRFDHKSDDFHALMLTDSANLATLTHDVAVDAHLTQLEQVIRDNNTQVDRCNATICSPTFQCINLWRSFVCV